jgi:hypothetical protein
MKARCVCGCGRTGHHRHHAVTRQRLRWAAQERTPRGGSERIAFEAQLVADQRNIVYIAYGCHAAHHNRSRSLTLAMLPDSVFEFAAEVLGPREAYVYLLRNYSGLDPRADALLDSEPEAA